jgi:GT2 family glycosyltransferase
MREKIPVTIINWDSVEIVELCIKYIRERTAPEKIEIQVVDNGSEDRTNLVRLLELRESGQVDRIIALPKNMGFSIAFNIAFKEAVGDIFCYVSSDCLVEPGWFEEGIKSLKADENIAAVCSNIFGDNNHDISKEDRELTQLYGAIMFMRRDAWSDTGCFDYRNFSPAYSEELDWSYRARKRGYRIVLAGKSLAYHNESYTMNKKYDRNYIHLIRLTHRIKCRLLNWTVRELFSSWKWYLLETLDDIKNKTIHILPMAFMKNFLMFPTILKERNKRLSGETIEFNFPYREIAIVI